ncbi:acyl-CoA thioesterase domain-containing protein [Mycolicibacterium sp. XJ870]
MPEKTSVSVWSDTQLGGYAVCGALARQIELDTATEGFIPARLTVDLFAPVRTEPLTVNSSTVRRGRRIIMVDATVTQSGEPRARATAIYMPKTADPHGDLWHSADRPPTPPAKNAEPGPPLIKSGHDDWTTDFAAGNNAERKAIWQNFPPIVDDEPLTAFQSAALIAENTSLVCNWGTHGPGFINTDTTLMLARLPIGPGIGLHADDHLSCNGVAVGTATLFDRHGPAGKCSVTALANARRQRNLG